MRKIILITYLLWFFFTQGHAFQMEADSVSGIKLYQEGLASFGKDPGLAVQKLKNAAEFLKKEGPWDKYVHALSGITFYYQKIVVKFDSAIKYTNLAFEGSKMHLQPEHNYYGMALNNKNVLDLQFGAFAQARDNFLFMLENEIYNKADSMINLAFIYNNLGQCYSDLGDYDEANRYFIQALSLLESTEKTTPYNLANQYNQLAKVYTKTEKLDKATELYDKAISLLNPHEKKHHRYLINYFHSMALIAIDQNQLDEAIRYLDSAKALQKKTPAYISTNYKILAEYYLKKGDYEHAISEQNKNFEELNARIIKTKKHLSLAETIQKQGEIHQHFGYTKKALERFQYGIARLSMDVDSTDLWQNPSPEDAMASVDLIPLVKSKARSLKLLAEEEKNDSLLELSLQTYELTMEMIAEVRAKFRSAKSREIISANYAESIEEALNLCFELYQRRRKDHYLNLALRFMELNKAALLQSSLKELEAKRSLGLPDSLLAYETKLNDQLADARAMLYKEESEGEGRPD